MIVCFCRNIDSDDYHTEDLLKERVMQDDFRCGQCQLRYLIEMEWNIIEEHREHVEKIAGRC